MNISDQRAALVTAIDAVTGVECYDERPKVPKPGDAWLALDALEPVMDLQWTGLWRVIVQLPSGPQAAATWVDTHFQSLVDAIRSGPGFADTGDVVPLVASGNDTNTLEITVRGD